jgi:hypothetical protein
MRIIILGYIVRGPIGGLAWHHLQYFLGLARLGHDVYFVEDSDDYPSCYDPARHVTDTDPTYGLNFAAQVFGRVALGDRWVYYDAHTARWLGPRADDIMAICSSAELMLDVSGVNPMRPWFIQIPARVLIDTDPVFTQIRHLTDPAARDRASKHTAFFTFGENIPSGSSTVPNDGLPWMTTRQPVVLDAWPMTLGPRSKNFTTVMQWDSYPALNFNGTCYAAKSESFEQYATLPSVAGGVFELALGGANAPRERLEKLGWRLRDPLVVTRDPWTYQRYIQESKAEFSVAKHGYAVARSGWFSERSAAYLASGRPVVVQDTGFTDWMRTDGGVIAFGNPEEALRGIEDVDRRYELHCREARAVAERYFDSSKVLPLLIERALKSS